MEISNEISVKNTKYKEIRSFMKKIAPLIKKNSEQTSVANSLPIHYVDKIPLFGNKEMYMPSYEYDRKKNIRSILKECI